MRFSSNKVLSEKNKLPLGLPTDIAMKEDETMN